MWYEKCTRPPWQPPSIVFKIVWPILYVLYALVLYLEWNHAETRNYLILGLVLNLCWVPLFMANARLALVLLVAMIAVALKSILLMHSPAKWIFVPYLLWISFASTLNAYIAVKC
jgi:tryptophan-rich sensory protein